LEAQGHLHITRVFEAPRTLVWKVWTDPEHLKHWMGPRGFVVMHMQHDLRPGGKWRICLHRAVAGEGCGDVRQADLWQSGEYREVVEPERLVFTFGWDGREDIPRHDTLVTITFEEHDGKTTMNFHQAVFPTIEDRDGHGFGWNSTFDRLEEYVREASGERAECDNTAPLCSANAADMSKRRVILVAGSQDLPDVVNR
jgi:uncharacterized protein YndB with AHSA1/START domain